MAETAVPLFEGATALEVADLLVLAAARRTASAFLVEPMGASHIIMVEQGMTTLAVASLSAALGDAVAARLAFIAGLDVGSAGEQLGRIRVAAAATESELLVAVRATQAGLGAELRRIARADDVRPQASGPSVSQEANRVGIYRVVGELGRGGMGVVYRAEHEALSKPVAIKVLYAQMARDPEIAIRFVREARAASRIRHPGIVDVTDFGTLPDGRAFLVMELVEGMTLHDLLAKGPLALARSVSIIRQIAAALDAAHKAGVVHRDLKPANVFLGDDDHVKIGDFGAAKLTEPSAAPSDTQRGTIFGTPFYMSPEHARGLETDQRTDLYSLGCVLFEMVTGRVPFDGQTAVDVLTKHITEPLPPVTSAVGPLPELLEATIVRAMAKRVEERYQSAREVLADLERVELALGRSGWRRWLPV